MESDRRRLLIVLGAAITGAAGLSGCVSMGKDFPEASPAYQVKKTYDLTFD